MSRLLWTRKAPLGELLAMCGGGGGLVEPLCCQSTAKLLIRQPQRIWEGKWSGQIMPEMQGVCRTQQQAICAATAFAELTL